MVTGANDLERMNESLNYFFKKAHNKRSRRGPAKWLSRQEYLLPSLLTEVQPQDYMVEEQN